MDTGGSHDELATRSIARSSWSSAAWSVLVSGAKLLLISTSTANDVLASESDCADISSTPQPISEITNTHPRTASTREFMAEPAVFGQTLQTSARSQVLRWHRPRPPPR